jgi:tetratricopeptide (TPR) repeat protein
VKKWIITILAAAAALALALTEQTWAQWIVSFAHGNHERIDELNTFAELISKFVMWPAAAVLFIIGLWLKKKDADVGHAQTVSVQTSHAARDINTAGRDVQTGGTHAERDLKVDGNVINQQTNIYQAATAAPTPTLSPLHQLPPPPADFTGRTAELRELRAAIEKGGIHISGLLGQGGVGKTALALKLAEELSPNYPDAQIYLDLKGVSEKSLTAAEAMSHVLRTFHPEAKLPEKEEDLRAQYLSVLHNKRALLLMDNAKDAAQVKPLIPPAGCTLLVTSRQHFALPGLQAKNLETLPPADAKALLLRIAPRIDGEAETVARLCGYLPQALRLAASAIAVRVNLEPQDYAKQLADEKKRLELLAGEDESVEASITLSYNLLDAETQKRWRMLGVFPDTFDAPAAAAVWEIGTDDAQDTLSQLLQYSMLEWNDATKRYRLHDLMRASARQRSTPAECDAAALRHTTHYGTVLAAADKLYLKGGDSIMRGLALFDLEWGNIRAGQAWAEANTPGDKEAAELCSNYPNWGSYVLDLRLHPREQLRVREAALVAARQLKDRRAEGAHLGYLGLAQHQLGDYRRAVEYHKQALSALQEVGDRLGEGGVLSFLGLAYKELGDARSATQYLERSLAIACEIGDKRGEGSALGNLGGAHQSLGDRRRAIEYYEKAISILREIGDRRGEGRALGNLGSAHARLGEAHKATECHEKALAISREIGDQDGEARDLGSLGNLYADLGDNNQAIDHYEQALTRFENVSGRQGEGEVLGSLGKVFLSAGNHRRATEYLERSLAIAREIGDQHGEGDALCDLGSARAGLGDHDGAIQRFKQSLAIAREIGDRYVEGTVLWNIAVALDKLGERKKAIEHAEAAVKLYEEIEDPSAAQVRRLLDIWKNG